MNEMRSIQILLVEDNEGDIVLTRQAIEEEDNNSLEVVKDGEDALDFLNKKGDYANCPLPDLILLDINLPKLNGHDLLRYIKGHEIMKAIPVIMFTTSSSRIDIDKAYLNGANSYITKSHNYETFIESIKILISYWTTVVKLPANPTD